MKNYNLTEEERKEVRKLIRDLELEVLILELEKTWSKEKTNL